MKFKRKLLFLPLLLLISSNLLGCGKTYGEKEYYIKNQYFSNSDTWDGTNDPSIDFLENKFGVKFAKCAPYTWNDWNTQVITDINDVKACPDVFHYNMDNKNFNAIQEWAELGLIRDIPFSMIDKYPNLKRQIYNLSSLDHMKINGKIYGLNLIRDNEFLDKNFSNASYIYRKDILLEDPEMKAWYDNQNIKDDVFTLDQFIQLLKFFKAKCESVHQYPFLEVGWGVLSLIDLYRDSMTCFTRDAQGKIVNNFTTEGFKTGLKLCKDLINQGLMARDNITQKNDNWGVEQYGSDNAFVLFQNFDFTNYTKTLTNLTKSLRIKHPTESETEFKERLLNATTFLKIKGDDGMIPVEGNENWYSVTLFKDGMSDTKLDKYLEILNYLIGDLDKGIFETENEGRCLATYGVENFDYTKEPIAGGYKLNFDLPTSRWKKKDGTYNTIIDNGAKFLRYTISVNEDVSTREPFANRDAVAKLNDWKTMMTGGRGSTVRVVLEPDDIRWANCEKKIEFNAILLSHATNMMKRYAVTPSMSIDDYVREVNSNSHWNEVLQELNDKLGK